MLVSQLPKLFGIGIGIDGHGPRRDLLQLGRMILAGEANGYSFAVGGGCRVLIPAPTPSC
ncbi:hypothetical protein E0E54_01625 [Azotobacter chroococcum]|uniref:hypothetical protein n=1 Tax=Azotobacter chroococcum TaxID=353 RepID=UPI00103937C2|nr:hypothetical protein [Azotobacter chroococcum]TBW39891.1 hypothetical protein E0E54_01625 [Azotobacter chroococcum]